MCLAWAHKALHHKKPRMRYIVINIGCLCCDTPSSVVGILSDKKAALEMCDNINSGMQDMKHECRCFPIADEDHVDKYFDDIIERGKKYREELERKHQARRAKASGR